MPDDASSKLPSNLPPADARPKPIPFHIGEEFGTAKKNLPPARIVLLCVGILIVLAALAAFLERPRPQAAGSIDDVVSVEIPNQNELMVAINVSFQNQGEKPFWIHTIKADLDTGSATVSDDAASASDFERYYQGFPVLKQHAIPALQPEARIEPGGRAAGRIIVAFHVTPDAFAARKSLRVTIQPYDQPLPLMLTR